MATETRFEIDILHIKRRKRKSRRNENDAKRFFIYVKAFAQVRTWKRYSRSTSREKVLPNTVNLSSGRLKKKQATMTKKGFREAIVKNKMQL
jgi:hypothetical protein